MWIPRSLLAAPLAALLVLPGCASRVGTVMTADAQRAATPASVLAELKAGNERFAAGAGTAYDWQAQVEATAGGQHPKAIVLSCLDSRVIPEVVFDQGIGDLFVGRVAGNVETTEQLGSMEFGTKVAGAKLVVVLGHTSCGAVKGAIDQARLDNLTALLAEIEPAVAAVPVGAAGRTSRDARYVNRVVEANVRGTMRDILDRSPTLRDMVDAGDLMVVGAVYDLESGRVHWLDA